MAFQRFVCCFFVMIIVLCKDCHSQQPTYVKKAVKTIKVLDRQATTPVNWPWLAFITVFKQFKCGGSLISDQWVLTAAQCISPQEIGDTAVFLGVQNLTGPFPPVVGLRVDKIICHPDYSNLTLKNNICLLKLSTPVNFTDYIQPICLAAENSTFYAGTNTWLTGFGITSNLTFPNILQEANVPVVGNNECQCYYEDLTFSSITENMICTGLQAGGTSSCYGDGGGALMIETGSVWIQIGIVSFSVGCARPLRPEVYTRVSQYQKWISDTITDTEPGFVSFTSTGTDSDLSFNCSAFVPPAPAPVPTTAPAPVPTTAPVPVPTTAPAPVPNVDVCDSVFCSGENLIHFTHFTSLCVLIALLHMFVGSTKM
ncbi:serine protease 27-like isoform X2 [Oreochromis niloticus]|uniref:serine protease 27-like isoform X2 n=1 Tax=Oreochromis niloticus TaxID=8128 RepID=UPI0009049F40|nr:serine protease 27-like isoform X2 [Oreochromis niloticus]